jgi:hypothetical protein
LPVDYKVPRMDFVEYEYFEIPTNFTEDKWCNPSKYARAPVAVVHHVIGPPGRQAGPSPGIYVREGNGDSERAER